MPNYNSITLEGHAGRDFELRYVGAKETPMLTGVVAYTDSPNTQYEETFWFKIIVFGDKAEQFAKLEIAKGNALRVKGISCKERDWVDRDGNDRTGNLLIKAFEIERLVKVGNKWVVEEETKSGGGDRFDDSGQDQEDIPF